MEDTVTTATDHQGTTTGIEMAGVTATETIEEIVAETTVTGTETEVVVGAVMIGVTVTGIVVVVAGIMTTIRDITKTTAAVTIELHATMTLDYMVEEEVGAMMEVFPTVSAVDEVEGGRNKKVWVLLKGGHLRPKVLPLCLSVREKLQGGMSTRLGTSSTLRCKPNRQVRPWSPSARMF